LKHFLAFSLHWQSTSVKIFWEYITYDDGAFERGKLRLYPFNFQECLLMMNFFQVVVQLCWIDLRGGKWLVRSPRSRLVGHLVVVRTGFDFWPNQTKRF